MRILGWFILLLAGLLTAALSYLQVADLRGEAAWAARTFLGRSLTIDGALDVDLLPAPRLSVEGLSLANADWGSQPAMLTVGRAGARVDPWSLVRGPIRIEDVHAADVTVLLERGESGVSNWSLAGPEADADPDPADPGAWLTATADFEVPAIVDRATLSKVMVTVRGREDQRYRVESLEVKRVGDGRQRVSLSGDLLGLDLSLTGQVDGLAGHHAGEPLALDLEGTLDTLKLTVGGALGPAETLTAALSSEDPGALLKHFGAPLPVAGPLEVTATLETQRAGWHLEADSRLGPLHAGWQADLANGALAVQAIVRALDQIGAAFDIAGLPATDLTLGARLEARDAALIVTDGEAGIGEARATFEATLEGSAVEAALEATGPRLADLGFELPAIPFRVALSGNLAPDTVRVPDLNATIGDSDLTGTLELELGDRLALNGDFESGLLDLTPFLPDPEPPPDAEAEPAATAAGTAGDDNDGAPGSAEEAGSDDRPLFSSAPLPFHDLSRADVDLRLQAARFVRGPVELEALRMNARIEAARLTGDLTFQAPRGGGLEGQVSLDAAERPAQLTMVAATRDLRINLMSGDQPPEQIPPLSLAIDIDASGDSAHELAASASGRVLFTLGPGRVSTTPLPWLSGDLLTELLSTLNPFRDQDPYSELDCLVTLLELDSGDGKLPVMLYQGQKIKVVGGGSVDLDKERLNIEFNTQPREGIGVSADMFVTPFVTVSGPLNRPGIGLNKKGALLQGGAAFLTGGLSAVVTAAFDRARGAQDDCQRARDAARPDGAGPD